MLIEVIICALAVFLLVGAMIAIPFIRVGERRREVLGVKALWYAAVTAIPLTLHLPLAIVYYHGAQLIGHAPRPMFEDPFSSRHDALYLFLQPSIQLTGSILVYPLVRPWLLPMVLCCVPTLMIVLGQRFRHLSKRDFPIMLLCLIAGWAFAILSSSMDWWLD